MKKKVIGPPFYYDVMMYYRSGGKVGIVSIIDLYFYDAGLYKLYRPII
jgi:hypothetical protein